MYKSLVFGDEHTIPYNIIICLNIKIYTHGND